MFKLKPQYRGFHQSSALSNFFVKGLAQLKTMYIIRKCEAKATELHLKLPPEGLGLGISSRPGLF